MNTQIEAADHLRVERDAAFYILARRIAEGEEVAPDEIERTCRDAGKEPTELDSVVYSCQKRARLRQKAAEAGEMQREMRELEEKVTAANEKLEESVAKHRRVCQPLQARLAVIRREHAETITIPTQLVRTCPNPILHRRNRELSHYSVRLQNAAGEAEREVRRAQVALRDEAERSGHSVPVEWTRLQLDARALAVRSDDPHKKTKGWVQRAQAALDAVRAEQAANSAAQDRLQDEMREY